MFIHLGRCVAYVYPPRQEPEYAGLTLAPPASPKDPGVTGITVLEGLGSAARWGAAAGPSGPTRLFVRGLLAAA